MILNSNFVMVVSVSVWQNVFYMHINDFCACISLFICLGVGHGTGVMWKTLVSQRDEEY